LTPWTSGALDRAASGRLYAAFRVDGAIAQLGERLNGIQEVRGSTPLGSTNNPGNRGEAMSGYDTDILEWSERQAALLRRMAAGEGVNDQVDWEHVAEEIESVGASERRELTSKIRAVLEHLMKLEASPATMPRTGWMESVQTARAAIEDVLEDSTSLKPTVPQVIERQLPRARRVVAAALAEHGETPRVPLEQLRYSEDQVVGDWFPDVSG
jgi:Domain of unknown function DUF29